MTHNLPMANFESRVLANPNVSPTDFFAELEQLVRAKHGIPTAQVTNAVATEDWDTSSEPHRRWYNVHWTADV